MQERVKPAREPKTKRKTGRVPIRGLRQPVAMLLEDRDRIIAAIDMLFVGN